MKHTIEIEGLPENIEIESAEICTPISSVYDWMSVGVILKTKPKKKQPRKIVLEEVNTVEYDLLIDNVTYNIVEDSGENDD